MSLALHPIVVLHHDIRSSSWDRETALLLEWYLKDFWAALTPGVRTPLFVVFLKVIYEPAAQPVRLFPWFRTRTNRQAPILQQIQDVLSNEGSTCTVHIVSELKSVTESDVKNWFSQHGIYTSEHKRRVLSASIFQGAIARPMADVEVALEEIVNEFVRHHSLERGMQAW